MLELALNEACIPMCGRVGGGLAAIVLDGEQRWSDVLPITSPVGRHLFFWCNVLTCRRVDARVSLCPPNRQRGWRRAPIPKADATIATCTPEETRLRLVVAAGWSLHSPEVAPRTHLLTCCPSLVRYCSKECQVAAWRTHKQRCSSTLRESLVNDPGANALNTALSKWINNWRFELHNWAVWAMDLANNPQDRLATHR
jgi:hypothetical protein